MQYWSNLCTFVHTALFSFYAALYFTSATCSAFRTRWNVIYVLHDTLLAFPVERNAIMSSPRALKRERVRAISLDECVIVCARRWNYSEFSTCMSPCGIGIQTRDVTCIHEVTRGNGKTVPVPNYMCPQPPPADRRYCNVWDCPVKWSTGEWGKVCIARLCVRRFIMPGVEER